jgi:signal transduction histidine kinase
MNRLIGDLVDLASIAAGGLAVTLELGDPSPIVTEAVDTFHEQALASGVSLVAEIAPSLPRVPFDPARVLQVLANLLSNAIKFTRPKGHVTVRVERVVDDICFAVSDTGIGVPPDQLEAVFERYVQLAKDDRRGVGLGLYISKCIVQGHGGKIWVESAVGQGSVFRFTLPVRVPSAG